jgi:hypothetical protein
MPQINNPRIIMLGNVKNTGEAFIKNDKKTGHEILFLREGKRTLIRKIADNALGIKKADAQVKESLEKITAGGAKLQNMKSFLTNNKSYQLFKNEDLKNNTKKNNDVVFISTPISMADIKNAEQLKVVSKNSVIGGSERKIYDEIKIPDHFDTAAKTSFRVPIEKNIRAFLNQNRGNEKFEKETKKIESTAALFANVVVDLLENKINKGKEKQIDEDKTLLLKFFETLPDNIQTKLKELNPTTFENKIPSPEKEKISQNEIDIKANTIPNKEILNDRTKLKELHTNYLKYLSVSELNTKENGSIENQVLNFSNKIIDFLYEEKSIDEPEIEKLIIYNNEIPKELNEKIADKLLLLKNKNDISDHKEILINIFLNDF